MTPEDAAAVMPFAVGRLFRMMSRPTQPGDVNDYYRVRSVILEAAEALRIDSNDSRPNWARDRNKGSAGD